MYSKGYKKLSELEWEDSVNKKEVLKEIFALEVIQYINGVKYLHKDILIGAMNAISHKFSIKCKESFEEVYNFISDSLHEFGY